MILLPQSYFNCNVSNFTFVNDQFAFWTCPDGIYYATFVNQYDENEPATEYLSLSKRLVSITQIQSDILAWLSRFFSVPYNPPNTQYINGYGWVYANLPVNPIPFSLYQLHPVYDPIDNTILLYFSIYPQNATPSTKAIYAYKIPISFLQSGGSITNTQLTTATPPPNDKPYFLGGLTLDPIVMQTVQNALRNQQFGNYYQEAYPQFTIASDPIGIGKVHGIAGQLSAIFVSTIGGSFFYGIQGTALFGLILKDIHTYPANSPAVYIPIVQNFGYAMPAFYPNGPNWNIPIFGHITQLITTGGFGISIYKFGSVSPYKGWIRIPVSVYVKPMGQTYTLLKNLYVSPIGTELQGYGGLAFAWDYSGTETQIDAPYIYNDRIITVKNNKAITLDIPPEDHTLITAPSLVFGQNPNQYYLVGSPNFANTVWAGVLAWSFGKKYARFLQNINANYVIGVNLYRFPPARTGVVFQIYNGWTPNVNNYALQFIPEFSGYYMTEAYIFPSKGQFLNPPYNADYPISDKIYVKGMAMYIPIVGGAGPLTIILGDE